MIPVAKHTADPSSSRQTCELVFAEGEPLLKERRPVGKKKTLGADNTVDREGKLRTFKLLILSVGPKIAPSETGDTGLPMPANI